MALGRTRTPNGGRDAQGVRVALQMARLQVTFKVTAAGPTHRLWVLPTRAGLTLPMHESHCDLHHVDRGRWEAIRAFDGTRITYGRSLLDVVGKVLETIR